MEQTLDRALAASSERDEMMPARKLERLFDAHHARLYRLARRMTSDPEEARDLVQQAFLRAARRPEAIPEGDRAGEAWMVRVLVNLCRDLRRRGEVRRREAGRVPPAAIAAGPEVALIARDSVQAALARLSPRRRAVVVLHELEEREPEEISALLGMATVTVRWHLSAGRRELRSILMRRETGE